MDKLEQLKRLWSSITGRLILGVIVVHVVLTPLLFYGILLIVERSFESQFIDQVRNNTLLYAELLKPSIEEEDEQKRNSFLYETIISGDVVFAEFLDTEGRTARADPNELEDELVFREDFEFGEHADQVYFIAAQLFSDIDGRPLGFLRLGYDELSVQEQIDAAYRFGSLIAGGYILFSTLLAIFFGRRLFKPVSSLRSFARSIAAGNRSVELQVDTNIFELKHLAEDLQFMHHSLVNKQQEILNRELRLEAILNHAGEGIITIDRWGNVHSFNLAAETIFGYTADEVLGQNLSILMPSRHAETHDDYISEYLRSGASKIIGTGRRVEAQRKDGRLIPIYLTISKVQQGEDVSFTGIMHDLSGEEQKEAELQQLSRAVEQSPVSILITNTEGNIEYVNPRFCHMTGYSADEVIGENPRFLNSGQTSAEDYRSLWGTISKGGIWRGVFQNKTKSGDLFWLSSTVCPVHDQAGEITHYISISEDITEARKKESMLAQAMKLEAIGRMTDGISHDFNNLLTIIQGNLKFLEQDMPGDNEEHHELIEDALSAAQDGADLIKRLLAFSRRQELDIRTKRLLQRSVPEIDIEMDLDDGIANALVDANRLESVVLNLITNARDAMAGGGTIKISTSNETVGIAEQDVDLGLGSYVVLTVTDDGIGMDEKTRQQAVEPFFTTKSIETGTGLGLTMVNDFVQQCGGELKIESALNEGTTIRLFLPSSQDPEDVKIDIEAENDLPVGEETILVVEDRESLRRFACRTLTRLGYNTYEAKDAAEALLFLQQHEDIELLFSDIVMPGDTDGRKLAHVAVKARPDLKVLLTTGMEPSNVADTESAEDAPLLQKPYSSEELAWTVRAILDAEIKS